MNMEFTKWLKEITRDKRHLKINNGWGVPEREFYFYTKDEVEEKWDEISKSDGVLINLIDLYSDINLTCSLFPWQYIIAEVAGTTQGDSKRKAFISHRTLLLHYIMTGHMEFYGRDKSINTCIFPKSVDPLMDTMVFIPRESYNNIIKDKQDTFGVTDYVSCFGS